MTNVHIVWVEVGLWEQEKLHGIGNFYTLQRSHDSIHVDTMITMLSNLI